MTFFEYALIPVSMLLAIAAARILEGFFDELQSENRYWVHLVYLIVIGSNVLQYLEGAWLRSQDIEADVGSPLSVIFAGSIVPGLLVLEAYCLTTAMPQAIADWRAHFFRVRRAFFTLNALRGSFLFVTYLRFPGEGVPWKDLVGLAVVIGYSVVGWWSPRPRVQAVAACFAALATVVFWVLRVTGKSG